MSEYQDLIKKYEDCTNFRNILDLQSFDFSKDNSDESQ